MFRPRAYIKSLKEMANVSILEYNIKGEIIGAVLDIDQVYIVDIVSGFEQTEDSPYWEINKIELIWPTDLKDITGREYYTDDILVDTRNNYKYKVIFMDGAFWANPLTSGFEGYETVLLSDVHALSRIISNEKCE